ncbi:MAG: hypothetical protein L3J28_04425 [Candidatus Polarisedimenticolaceae bacterium]|nr:hypothetical protein [Candidatus Polarisedimenticolaceae bacterium]
MTKTGKEEAKQKLSKKQWKTYVLKTPINGSKVQYYLYLHLSYWEKKHVSPPASSAMGWEKLLPVGSPSLAKSPALSRQ